MVVVSEGEKHMDPRYVLNCIVYLPSYCRLIGAEETRSPEARRREPRTHSYRHRGALRHSSATLRRGVCGRGDGLHRISAVTKSKLHQ
jgi:hypothetical protein